MELLAKLTPAETHLMLEQSNADLKDLMKYTLMDLLLKRVIKTTQVKKRSHRNDPARVYSYVVADKNLASYKPLPHEMIYLSPYFKSSSIKILFRHLVTMGIQNSGGEKKFVRNYLMPTPNLKGHFETGFFTALFGTVKLNNKGLLAQKEIEAAIAQLEQELPELIRTNQTKALEILLTIKGNIFLLKNLDFSLLAQIDKELIKQFKHQNQYYDSGYYGFIPWPEYDAYADSFDSSFASASASTGDDGCSSCSGCTGCSGCGGCT